jgi:hypothetical protein
MHVTSIPQSALLRAEEIPSFSLLQLDWNNQARWPMVTLPGGGSADYGLPLQSAFPFRNEQEYDVTISTVLTMFVGEGDDSDARLFPLRIPVSAAAHFRW